MKSIEQAYYDEGRVEVRLETKKQIVLNLLKQKAPMDLITNTTGFSIKEIQALKKTNSRTN